MEFRKVLHIKPFDRQLSLQDKVMFIGSCFSENLGGKLQEFKFNVSINPNGTLFNPVSICRSILSYIQNKKYTSTDIFFHQELWKSWDHHSIFSNIDQDEILNNINTNTSSANEFLKNANWLIITLGSAWVYENESGEIVANCHKLPSGQFKKRLLSAQEVKTHLSALIDSLIEFNPTLNIMFTISPVRHLRDGFIENNRSKAVLIQSVHELIEEKNQLYYFPAYELVMDDLRDYRFYAEDMVHPNDMAIQYVWEKFQQACIGEHSLQYFPDIHSINVARLHKPFQPDTVAHKKFREKNFEMVQKLKNALPYLNWQPELDFFKD